MQTEVVSREAPMRSRVVESSNSIVGMIASQAAAGQNRLAIDDASRQISFGELDRLSNQLASHLIRQRLDSNSCIALFLDRSADFAIAALASMKAGLPYLPMDSSTPRDRAAFILEDAGASIVITHHNKSSQLAPGAFAVIELDGKDARAIASQSADAIGLNVATDRLAYVIYTSGSTGTPKGVEITHDNLLNLIHWHNGAFGVTRDDRASQVAGLGFDAAGWEIWPHLCAGASVHIADEQVRRSSPMLRDWLVRERITISFVPTALTEQLLHASWPAETALRTLLTGADTLYRRPAAGLPFKLINNYGPTECTVVTTSGLVAAESGASGQPSIGRPIDNATTFILDENLNPVAPGEPGELCIAGALLARGYRNNPQMTASRFVMIAPGGGKPVRIYRTGDRVRLQPNGEIAFLGRLDDQVKIRGYRIELGEIVVNLDRFPGIAASAVIARDKGEERTLVAYLVAAPDAKINVADVRDFLAARLPDYMIPQQFVKLADLPLTANAKLDKTALPEPSAENLLGVDTSAAQLTSKPESLEQRIAEMVAKLLNQSSVELGANFFMLGGHSMLGVQLAARIKDTFGVKLTLRQLFGAPTVAALSAEITRLAQAPKAGG